MGNPEQMLLHLGRLMRVANENVVILCGSALLAVGLAFGWMADGVWDKLFWAGVAVLPGCLLIGARKHIALPHEGRPAMLRMLRRSGFSVDRLFESKPGLALDGEGRRLALVRAAQVTIVDVGSVWGFRLAPRTLADDPPHEIILEILDGGERSETTLLFGSNAEAKAARGALERFRHGADIGDHSATKDY